MRLPARSFACRHTSIGSVIIIYYYLFALIDLFAIPKDEREKEQN